MPDKPRNFDSNDPFPDRGLCGDFVDGQPNVSVLLNGKQIWPSPGQTATQNAKRVVPHRRERPGTEGRPDYFSGTPNRAFDTLEFDPTIRYSDGETHVASKEFSTQQGENGWRYQFAEKENLPTWCWMKVHHEWHVKKGRYAGAFCRCRCAARRIDRRCRTDLDGEQSPERCASAVAFARSPCPRHRRVARFSSRLLELCSLGRPLQPCFARWTLHRLGLFRSLGLIVHAWTATAASRHVCMLPDITGTFRPAKP